MTHPAGSLPLTSSEELNRSDDTHSSGSVGSLPLTSSEELNHSDDTESSDPQTETDTQSVSTLRVIDDYLIVPQDAPLNERPAIYTSGDLYTFLVTSKETNFGLNAFDFFVPPGGGPSPHIHNYEHEAFFVEEGNVRFFLGNEAGVPGTDKEIVLDGVPAGTFIFGPRLRPHGFANPDSTAAQSGTNEGARLLSLTSPGGLDYLFEAAGDPVEDRNDPIPPPPPPGVNPAFIEFGQRTGYRGESFPDGISFPGYEPPEGTPNYVLVLPDDAPEGLKENIEAQVAGVDGFSIWNASERPKFTGPFGIEYTSLASFEETEDSFGNPLSYNQFSLAPQATDTFVQANLTGSQMVEPTESSATGVATVQLNEQGDLPGEESDFYFQVDTEGNPTGEIRGQIARTTDDFPDPIESENQEVFYVKEGQLSFKINDQVRLAGPDTFVYIAPGNEYSIGNFGDTEVESLAISVPPAEDGPVIPDDTGYNPIEGSEGNDLLLAGSKDNLIGGAGDDTLRIVSGGDNILYGGSGADQFWIADGRLPDTVPETRQATQFGLPPLEDTRNTIVDFEIGIDKIHIRGISGISSFDDLKLLPVFGDIRSTSILATVDGMDGEVSLANVTGIVFNELSAEDFVFA